MQQQLQQQQLQLQQQQQMQQRAVQQQQMQQSSPSLEQAGPSAPVALHANEQALKQSEKHSKESRSLLSKAWRALTGGSHVRTQDRETIQQSEKSGESKYWWSKYAFYFLEGFIFLCCMCMCCIGNWNKFVKESKYLNQVQNSMGIDDET